LWYPDGEEDLEEEKGMSMTSDGRDLFIFVY